MQWITFALITASFVVWVYASFSRSGTRPGEGGTRPIWTNAFAVLSSAAITCVPAIICGIVAYRAVQYFAHADTWGDRWGVIGFWLTVLLTSIGAFFPLIWSNLFYIHTVPAGNNGSLLPFGKRWRGHWLSEGDQQLPWFVDVTNVDMRMVPGSPPIIIEEPSKDKTKMTIKMNWYRKPYDPDAWLDAQNQDYAFNIALEASARDYIKNRTDDELTGPGIKNDMAKEVSKTLRKLAKDYADDPKDPGRIKKYVGANVLELFPPKQEVDAAGDAKANKIRVKAYIERFETFAGTNHGLKPVELWAAFERHEGVRETDQIIIDGLSGNSNPIVAAGASYLASRAQEGAGRKNRGGKNQPKGGA